MPLLPWAPISEPWAMAVATCSMLSAPWVAATTDSTVRVMLVPVSPSGTG